MAENQQIGHGRSPQFNRPPVPVTATGLPVPPPNPHQQATELHSSTTHTSTTNVINIEINKPPSAEMIVVEEHIVVQRWTCCGMGIGWFLFVLGWFLCGIPWYAGFFVLICGRFDRRELPGLLACATFAVVVSVVATIQAIQKKHQH